MNHSLEGSSRFDNASSSSFRIYPELTSLKTLSGAVTLGKGGRQLFRYRFIQRLLKIFRRTSFLRTLDSKRFALCRRIFSVDDSLSLSPFYVDVPKFTVQIK